MSSINCQHIWHHQDRRRPMTEDNLRQKTTFHGRRPLTEDDLWRKTTFDGRRPLTEDDLWRKTTFDGRQPLIKYDLWRKMTFDRRQPLTDDDLWRKMTFDRVHSMLHENNVYDSSPWQLQHNWPQIGNPISCQNRKKNFMWWKKCTRHHVYACVLERWHF